METNKELSILAEKVKTLFEESRGAFDPDDFVETANLLGFQAYQKPGPEEALKPVAEHHLPDIISTNLQYAVNAYEWKTHIPMTDDGFIVSGFWDATKNEDMPAGYEMSSQGRFLTPETTKAVPKDHTEPPTAG
jgi:hypothetical protein